MTKDQGRDDQPADESNHECREPEDLPVMQPDALYEDVFRYLGGFAEVRGRARGVDEGQRDRGSTLNSISPAFTTDHDAPLGSQWGNPNIRRARRNPPGSCSFSAKARGIRTHPRQRLLPRRRF